jgi:hypothetical protein
MGGLGTGRLVTARFGTVRPRTGFSPALKATAIRRSFSGEAEFLFCLKFR